MSLEEIKALEAAERELAEKLAALRAKRSQLELAEKEKAEREKPLNLLVTDIRGSIIFVEGNQRPDLLEIWRETPGRIFRGYTNGNERGINGIPLAQWQETLEKIRALPNTTINFDIGVEEKIDWHLNAAPWEVDIYNSHLKGIQFIARPGPEVNRWKPNLSSIPGTDWDHNKEAFFVPVTEGWRIFERLQGIDGVIYSDAAKEMIFTQVEDRHKLDKIIEQEDSDDERLKLLDRPIWDKKKQKDVPFYQWMRPFQRVGTHFLLEAGGRVILADDTGLGKTIQTIAFAEIKRKQGEVKQVVCAVKSANMANWRREIIRLTGEEPLICSNYPKTKAVATHHIMTKQTPYVLISQDLLGTYDLPEGHTKGDAIIKENLLYYWVEILKGAKPDLLIIDEAHQIKNPDAHRSYAIRQLHEITNVIPATASPVLNRTNELWPLLFMVKPDLFKSSITFERNYTYDGRTPKNVDELHELIKPIFIRRRKRDVIKDLPAINRIQHLHSLSAEARSRYDDVLAGIYEQLSIYDAKGQGGETMNVTNILAQITRLKQICAADKIDFVVNLAVELIDESSEEVSDEWNPDPKVLIFSQFKGSAYAIAQRLGHEAICTVERGADDFVSLPAPKRDELFEKARHDPKVKFIVTTEAAKEGHNLEFCNWVIFNDLLWTPAGHDQCEGRAYGRLSNPHPIDSFYIIADVDVEHWIMELLEAKLELIDEAIEGIESHRDISGSIAKDLIEKMKAEMWTKSKGRKRK